MRFDAPWMLLLGIPALALVLAISRRGRGVVPAQQRRWATRLRVVAVAALVAAMALPSLVLPSSERSVVFLLDRSASVGETLRTTQSNYLTQAVAEAPPDVRWAVAVFGADTVIDRALAPGTSVGDVRSSVDADASDIGEALRAVAAVMPSEGSRRVVLLSDMRDTGFEVRATVDELERSGIAVDVVQLEGTDRADAILDGIDLPASARVGDVATATIRVRSSEAGPATLTVWIGDGEPQEIAVELEVGANRFDIDVPADATGFLPVRARIDAQFDTVGQNDEAAGLTRILGPASVVVVEGVPGEADELARALDAGGLEVDVTASIPSDVGLLSYDAVILVNVDAPSDQEAATLAAFVEDLGRGLVVVGGDQSFGLGDYQDSPLEAVLPVSSEPDDERRRQPVAEVIVVDTSGSMGACHCGEGNQAIEGGINKTDISRAGAALAIDALAPTDRVGVLAFSSGYDWVIPLAEKPSDADVESALAGLLPEGDTEISVALEAALEELSGAPEQLKHVVLFTDGWDPTDADLIPVARRMAEEGVTLSVLGTGEGPGTVLERMAEVGGGRYYPGDDLEAIPEIFVEETLAVARSLAQEGSFLPAIAGRSPAVDALTESPPLLGYVLTKPKGTASTPLVIGQDDPLLATWQRGLGTVSAWTSDATARWSAAWVDWDGFVSFWGAVVRDTLPPGRENPPAVTVDGGTITIDVGQDGLGDGATAVARIRRPDGEIVSTTLDRTGVSTFEGSASADRPGAYWVAVTIDDGAGGTSTVSSGAVSSYQEEFAFRQPDPVLAADIARISGGRVDAAPTEVWTPAPARGESERTLWPWLLLMALGLFLVDVVLRRLVIVESTVEDWRAGLEREVTRERRRVAAAVGGRSTDEPPSADQSSTLSDSETIQRLMRRKR